MAEEKKSGGMMGMVVALAIVTAIGGGAGFGFGMFLPQLTGGKKMEAATAEGEAADSEAVNEEELRAVPVPMPAIITNLATPDAWIRLEATLMVDAEEKGDAEHIIAESTGIIQAYLRTATVAQIEGPSGLLHLREDLLDSLHATQGEKIKQLIIASMVVE